jgi:chromosome segregation ATPase
VASQSLRATVLTRFGQLHGTKVVVVLSVLGLVLVAGSAIRVTTSQAAQIDILVRDLAVTSNELATTSGERDQQAARAVTAELRSAELTGDVARLNNRLADAESSLTEANRLVSQVQDENATIRSRLLTVQSDAQSATSDAEAARAAQARAQRVSTAALTFATATDALSATRNRMLNLCNDTMSAVTAGRLTTAVSLERQYNSYVPTHNRQLATVESTRSDLLAIAR